MQRSSGSLLSWVLKTQGTAILAAAQVLCSKRGAFKEVYVGLTEWWCMRACNVSTQRLKEEDCKFQASLGYLARFLPQTSNQGVFVCVYKIDDQIKMSCVYVLYWANFFQLERTSFYL